MSLVETWNYALTDGSSPSVNDGRFFGFAVDLSEYLLTLDPSCPAGGDLQSWNTATTSVVNSLQSSPNDPYDVDYAAAHSFALAVEKDLGLHGLVASKLVGSNSLPHGSLACTVQLKGAYAYVYEVGSGGSSFAGKARITFFESDREIVFPVRPVVAVLPEGSAAIVHTVPLGDSGASAGPDGCAAVPAS